VPVRSSTSKLSESRLNKRKLQHRETIPLRNSYLVIRLVAIGLPLGVQLFPYPSPVTEVLLRKRDASVERVTRPSI